MGRSIFRNAANLRTYSKNFRSISGQRCQCCIGGKSGINGLAEILAKLVGGPVAAHALRHECERDTRFVKNGGTADFLSSQTFAFFAHAGRQIRFSWTCGGKIEPENYRYVFRFEPIGGFPGVSSTDNNWLEPKFRSKVERTMNLIDSIRLECDREFTFQTGPKGFQARVVWRLFAGSATSFVGCPLPLQPTRIEHRLAVVCDDSHKGHRIFGAKDASKVRVLGDGSSQSCFARDCTAQADESTGSRKVTAIGNGKLGREAGTPPRSDRFFIEFQCRMHGELRRETLAIIRLGGRERVGSDVFNSGCAGLGTTQRRVVPALASGIEEPGINSKSFTFGNQSIGGNGDVGADRGDQTIADDDGCLR